MTLLLTFLPRDCHVSLPCLRFFLPPLELEGHLEERRHRRREDKRIVHGDEENLPRKINVETRHTLRGRDRLRARRAKSKSSLRDFWQNTNSLKPGRILYLNPATAANRLRLFWILTATRICPTASKFQWTGTKGTRFLCKNVKGSFKWFTKRLKHGSCVYRVNMLN